MTSRIRTAPRITDCFRAGIAACISGALVLLSCAPIATTTPTTTTAAATAKSGECWASPCSLRADFDGDGAADFARLVIDPQGRHGIAISFANGRSALAGAGRALGNGGDDFAWLDEWRVQDGPHGACLYVTKREAAGADICWSGNALTWEQLGD